MGFPLTLRSMTLDCQILLEFPDISHVSEAITAKLMEIDPYCQRRNCSPLNAFFSDVQVTSISQGVHPLWGVKQVRGGEKCVNITRQMALRLLHSRHFSCFDKKKQV